MNIGKFVLPLNEKYILVVLPQFPLETENTPLPLIVVKFYGGWPHDLSFITVKA